MLTLNLHFEHGEQEVRHIDLPVTIGKSNTCGLNLKSWRIGKQHARIELRHGQVFVEDLGHLGGTTVNGARIALYGPLKIDDELLIGPCLMRVMALPQPSVQSEEGPVHEESRKSAAWLEFSAGPDDLAHEACESSLATNEEPEDSPDCRSRPPSACDETLLAYRKRLHAALLEALDLRRRDVSSMSDCALRTEATTLLGGIIEQDVLLPAWVCRQGIVMDVVNEAIGLGPLERLLGDPGISEIMVNRHDEIYVERGGCLHRHDAAFSSEQAVQGVIERIVSPLGRRIDESSPMVDARLSDGSRVNAVIPPIALRGASLTIRKFAQRRLSMADLIRMQALDHFMSQFLQACVTHRKSIVVSGGTGSGKTTLLNILSNCIPEGERIVTIEDSAELRLAHEHLVSLESRPANLEGRGCVDIRDLVRNALRMRPDRIVVGECRGSEAFDMLTAMNTGHEGSLTTLHANTPRDALARLETMVLMAGMDLPLAAIREHIASSIDLIVQQVRLAGGRRLLTSIVEITGMESGRIQTQELFRYVSGASTAFVGCGIMPECFTSDSGGNALPLEWFMQSTPISLENVSEPTFSSTGLPC
jgi:pilus assembly protein CpaF